MSQNDSLVTSHSRWSEPGVCLVNRARASRDGSASQRVYWQCPVPSVVVNVADVSKMKRTFTFRVALQLPHVRRGIRLDLFGHWSKPLYTKAGPCPRPHSLSGLRRRCGRRLAFKEQTQQHKRVHQIFSSFATFWSATIATRCNSY
jgi:hypothetical protein